MMKKLNEYWRKQGAAIRKFREYREAGLVKLIFDTAKM
jgi:hypothetical protein